jgi:hypothetical protein
MEAAAVLATAAARAAGLGRLGAATSATSSTSSTSTTEVTGMDALTPLRELLPGAARELPTWFLIVSMLVLVAVLTALVRTTDAA